MCVDAHLVQRLTLFLLSFQQLARLTALSVLEGFSSSLNMTLDCINCMYLRSGLTQHQHTVSDLTLHMALHVPNRWVRQFSSVRIFIGTD